MGKLENIIKGWASYIEDTLYQYSKIDPPRHEMSVKRLLICEDCPIRTMDFCNPFRRRKHKDKDEIIRGCGCKLAAKTLLEEEHCPAGEW